MKGLLLKDYFVIKSSMIILLIGFVVFGFGVSFYAPPYVLMLIGSIMIVLKKLELQLFPLQ